MYNQDMTHCALYQNKVRLAIKVHTFIRDAACAFDMSVGKIWVILRVHLKWFPYKPNTVQTLTKDHRRQRNIACNFFVSKDKEWFRRVIFSDLKWLAVCQSLISTMRDIGHPVVRIPRWRNHWEVTCLAGKVQSNRECSGQVNGLSEEEGWAI